MSISELGSSESMVLKPGRVNGRRGRKGTCGGVGRGRRSGDARGSSCTSQGPGSCPFGSGRPSQDRRAGGPRERWKKFDGAQPSLTAVRAAFGIGPEDAGEKSFDGFGFGGFWGRRFECILAGGRKDRPL